MVWLEKHARDVSHKHILLRFVLNRLYRVDHAHIFALLKGNFGHFKLHKFEALLADHFEELLGEFLRNSRNLQRLFVLVTGQILQKVPQIALVAIIGTPPRTHIRMSRQILTSDAICARIRIHIAIFKNHRGHVTIYNGHNTWLLLVNFVELEIFGQMNDRGSFHGKGREQISLHLLCIHGRKKILVAQIPQHRLRFGLEIGDQNRRFINWIEKVSISCVINTDTLGSVSVWEDFFDGILP